MRSMSKLFGAGVGLVLLAMSSSANAYVVTYSAGMSGPFASVITFDGLSAVTPPATGPANANNLVIDGVTFTGTGLIANGTYTNFYAAPAGDSSNFMAVLSGASETISYSSLM